MVSLTTKNTIPVRDRKRINKQLHIYTSGKYFDVIPLEGIFSILRNEGLMPVQEENTEWEGFLCGGVKKTEIVYFTIADATRPEPAPWNNGRLVYNHLVTNAVLSLSYYLLGSGRWEIISYIS